MERYFCAFSRVCYIDPQYSSVIGTGCYFIHYIGRVEERTNQDYTKNEHYRFGVMEEVSNQLSKLKFDLDKTAERQEVEYCLGPFDDVVLISTVKLQQLGEAFLCSLVAYAYDVQDEKLQHKIVSIADKLGKKRSFQMPEKRNFSWAVIS